MTLIFQTHGLRINNIGKTSCNTKLEVLIILLNTIIIVIIVGLGGLGLTCSPRDPRFAGSNPTEVDEFFQDVKILSTSPPGGTLSWGSRV